LDLKIDSRPILASKKGIHEGSQTMKLKRFQVYHIEHGFRYTVLEYSKKEAIQFLQVKYPLTFNEYYILKG